MCMYQVHKKIWWCAICVCGGKMCQVCMCQVHKRRCVCAKCTKELCMCQCVLWGNVGLGFHAEVSIQSEGVESQAAEVDGYD